MPGDRSRKGKGKGKGKVTEDSDEEGGYRPPSDIDFDEVTGLETTRIREGEDPSVLDDHYGKGDLKGGKGGKRSFAEALTGKGQFGPILAGKGTTSKAAAPAVRAAQPEKARDPRRYPHHECVHLADGRWLYAPSGGEVKTITEDEIFFPEKGPERPKVTQPAQASSSTGYKGGSSSSWDYQRDSDWSSGGWGSNSWNRGWDSRDDDYKTDYKTRETEYDYTETQVKLWAQVEQHYAPRDRFKVFIELCEENSQVIDAERRQDAHFKKRRADEEAGYHGSGPQSDSYDVYMVTQLQSSSSAQAVVSDTPAAGDPSTLHPLSMDWSAKDKRKVTETEQEQMARLEREKAEIMKQLQRIDEEEKALESAKAGVKKTATQRKGLGERASDGVHEQLSRRRRETSAAAAAARREDEPSDEEFKKSGANTLWKTAPQRPELKMNFRGEPDKLSFHPAKRELSRRRRLNKSLNQRLKKKLRKNRSHTTIRVNLYNAHRETNKDVLKLREIMNARYESQRSIH